MPRTGVHAASESLAVGGQCKSPPDRGAAPYATDHFAPGPCRTARKPGLPVAAATRNGSRRTVAAPGNAGQCGAPGLTDAIAANGLPATLANYPKTGQAVAKRADGWLCTRDPYSRPSGRIRGPAAIPLYQLIRIPILIPVDSGTGFR
jgi:hypothetical protein